MGGAARPPSGGQTELRHGDQRAIVVEVGGGLRSYEVAGRPVLDGYPESEMCSSARGQLLLPWPNRIDRGAYEFGGEKLQLPLTEPPKQNAIHGLARWSSWELRVSEPERAVLVHQLHPQDGYPFALDFEVEYRLHAEGLTVAVSAVNVGDRPCPFAAGAHPYITAGTELVDAATLRIPAERWLPVDERGIPTGVEPIAGSAFDFREPRTLGGVEIDTAFTDLIRDPDGRARLRLADPEGAASVEVWLDASYPYLMVFTGDTLPDERRRRRGLGVEPMTCAPNAFRTGAGLLVLQPGERFAGEWGISPRGAGAA